MKIARFYLGVRDLSAGRALYDARDETLENIRGGLGDYFNRAVRPVLDGAAYVQRTRERGGPIAKTDALHATGDTHARALDVGSVCIIQLP